MPEQVLTTSSPQLAIPAHMVPTWRVTDAFEKGLQNNLLVYLWGGLGDQVCAEPTIRYMLRTFKGKNISLASANPELFEHLEFHEVFDLKKHQPLWEKYFVMPTIVPPEHLLWEFVSHCVSHPVDFTTICMLRMTLPIEDKRIQLPDFAPTDQVANVLACSRPTIVVHPGKHWPSKTFPVDWWRKTISYLASEFQVALIGKKVDENIGYVDVGNDLDVIDLRDQLSLGDLISLLKNADYVFSNDSAPIHIAASGNANIAFVASCKHPDYLLHWRTGKFGPVTWGYKTKNLGKGGLWNLYDHSPIQTETVTVEHIPEDYWPEILPDPSIVLGHFTKVRSASSNIS